MRLLSTAFSEKSNGITEGDFGRLRGSSLELQMPKKFVENPIPDYVQSVNQDPKLTYEEIARVANRLGGEISKTQAQAISSGSTDNPGVRTLASLAIGLGKSPSDFVRVALGEEVTETNAFRKSEFGVLWELYQSLPPGEQKIMKRFLQIMRREMLRVLKRPDDSQAEK